MPLDQAPYFKDELCSHVPYRLPQAQFEWRDNAPFHATMRFVTTRRGQSSAIFILVDELGREFPMFMSEMLRVVQMGFIQNGVVSGTWEVCKRGSNYSVRYLSAS